jgi:alpha-D-xyloside xylohydrolase
MYIQSMQHHADALVLHTPDGLLKLQVCAEHIIRVVFAPGFVFSHRESLMATPQPANTAAWEVEETAEAVILRTAQVRVTVNRETGALAWWDAEGHLLVREPERGGRQFREIPVEKIVVDDGTEFETVQTADGVKARLDQAKTYVDRKAFQGRLNFAWSEGEALYGLGQHEEGTMNRRGTHQFLYQENMKVAMPVLLSTRGYGLFFDAYSLMTFHDDAFGSHLWFDVVDEFDYYFIYGPEFDRIVAGIRRLTGSAALLPKWAFGYVQSKERYHTQDEVVLVVREYRRRNIPLDVIVQDWLTWSGYLWGQKSFDPDRFPDPAGMMEDVHALNAHLMISIWPLMQNNGPDQVALRERGYLLADGSIYDAFNPGARALYWQQANAGLFSKGIDAWWCDCSEPTDADWNGAYQLEAWQRMEANTTQLKRLLDPALINAYSLLHCRGIYEGQRSVTDRKRVLNLTRSGYPGQQRYGTVVWSGDVTARWATLRRQIPEGLNFCASGFPYWTVDIGAFFVKKKPELWFWDGEYPEGCDDLGYRELYVRWFQYGAFLPMFRSHGTDTPREVWRFGEPGSATYDTLVTFINLRYRLLPYIYALAGSITFEHNTLLRALAFDFRHDPQVYDIADQFMFGPALLVNPVTTPMYYTSDSTPLEGVAKTRKVYLPQGCDWYDFWTGERYAGGQTIEADAPLERLPLYVRSGGILPMGPVAQYAGEHPDAPYEVRIYPGTDGVFTLYEDAGDSYDYEQGAYARITLRWDDAAGTLTIEERQGAFPGMVAERDFRLVVVRPGVGTGVEEVAEPTAVIRYSGARACAQVQDGLR